MQGGNPYFFTETDDIRRNKPIQTCLFSNCHAQVANFTSSFHFSTDWRVLRIQGVLQLLSDLAAHLVGKSELQFRKHLFVEDRPHNLVVELLLTLAATLAPVLDIEEPEVQRYEVVNRVAAAGDLLHRGRVVGKAAQLS